MGDREFYLFALFASARIQIAATSSRDISDDVCFISIAKVLPNSAEFGERVNQNSLTKTSAEVHRIRRSLVVARSMAWHKKRNQPRNYKPLSHIYRIITGEVLIYKNPYLNRDFAREIR